VKSLGKPASSEEKSHKSPISEMLQGELVYRFVRCSAREHALLSKVSGGVSAVHKTDCSNVWDVLWKYLT